MMNMNEEQLLALVARTVAVALWQVGLGHKDKDKEAMVDKAESEVDVITDRGGRSTRR